jgi:hypothetical protein
MPLSGRITTSTVNDPSIDNDEYYAEDSGGLRKLRLNAYGEGYLDPPTRIFWQARTIEFECVFVGTRPEFSMNGRNCGAWLNGDPAPPKFPKRSVGPDPQASPELTTK